MLASVLLRLARIYGDDELEQQAVSVFRTRAPRRRPRAARLRLKALSALDLHFSPPHELAIVGPPDSGREAALARFDPRVVVAVGPADGVPLLDGKELVDGQPAVYVCENFACRAPVTDPGAVVNSNTRLTAG